MWYASIYFLWVLLHHLINITTWVMCIFVTTGAFAWLLSKSRTVSKSVRIFDQQVLDDPQIHLIWSQHISSLWLLFVPQNEVWSSKSSQVRSRHKHDFRRLLILAESVNRQLFGLNTDISVKVSWVADMTVVSEPWLFLFVSWSFLWYDC